MKYAKTEAGQRALKERAEQLTRRQRSAMIFFDGRKTLDEVMAVAAGLGVMAADIEYLLALGYLAAVEEGAPSPARAGHAPAVGAQGRAPEIAAPLNKTELFRRAWPVATRLTAMLGLRGFRLNLAVEAASGYDDLLALLPRITDALGAEIALELKDALQA